MLYHGRVSVVEYVTRCLTLVGPYVWSVTVQKTKKKIQKFRSLGLKMSFNGLKIYIR